MSPCNLRMTRRAAVLGSLMAYASTTALAGTASLPVPSSLPEALTLALKSGNPLVILASLDGCPFCKIARENYLQPLQTNPTPFIVQLNLRSQQTVVGFDGISYSHDQWLKSWGIKVAPTVLFVGLSGKEIAERLVGGYLPDFYGAYLDERLNVARAVLSKAGAAR